MMVSAQTIACAFKRTSISKPFLCGFVKAIIFGVWVEGLGSGFRVPGPAIEGICRDVNGLILSGFQELGASRAA